MRADGFEWKNVFYDTSTIFNIAIDFLRLPSPKVASYKGLNNRRHCLEQVQGPPPLQMYMLSPFGPRWEGPPSSHIPGAPMTLVEPLPHTQTKTQKITRH